MSRLTWSYPEVMYLPYRRAPTQSASPAHRQVLRTRIIGTYSSKLDRSSSTMVSYPPRRKLLHLRRSHRPRPRLRRRWHHRPKSPLLPSWRSLFTPADSWGLAEEALQSGRLDEKHPVVGTPVEEGFPRSVAKFPAVARLPHLHTRPRPDVRLLAGGW